MTTIALKRRAEVIAGQSPSSADVHDLTDDMLPFLQGNAEFGTLNPSPKHACDVAPKRAHSGDILLSVRAPVGALNVADRNYGIGRGLCAVRARAEADGRFLWWALHESIEALASLATGSTYTAVTADDVGSLQIPDLTLAEQRAIANYLDAETARIDALIAKKQQLIHLLEERFAAAREQLLTRPSGELLATSRTGFFDAVPQRWEETVLRHLGVEVQTGPFGSQLHAEEYVEGGWPVVNPANIRDGRIRRLDNMTISHAKRTELERHVLRKGDIVFGRRGEMGRAALVGDEEVGWLCGTGSLRLRVVSRRVDPSYLAELLQTQALRNYFILTSVGSTMDNLNSEIVLSMPCLVPDPDQQSALVDDLKRTRSHSERLVDHLARQLELLAEHRQALITAAVTVEFTVQGAE